MVYGFGFISLMFLGFLSGFMMGKHIFMMSNTNSLILSLFVGTFTMMMEAILMIIRIHQMERYQAIGDKAEKKSRM
jgi:ABC-type antimicrobial peptide transport system permease subunit